MPPCITDKERRRESEQIRTDLLIEQVALLILCGFPIGMEHENAICQRNASPQRLFFCQALISMASTSLNRK
jgi:hypothetical protein